MTKLSYSTMSNLQLAPHTWIQKVLQVPTFTTSYFEAGKNVHGIIQRHCSGVEKHPSLSHLPEFNRVEKVEMDEDMHVTKEYNGYLVHGYVDMISDEREQFCDIKSGSPWGVSKMAKHPQFWLYSWMLGYNDFLMINCPKEVDEWTDSNITMMNMTFTKTHHKKAQEFVDKSIHIIKNIKDYIAEEDFSKSKRFCYYKDCQYCGGSYDQPS